MAKIKNYNLSEGWNASDISNQNFAPKKLPMRLHESKNKTKPEYVWPDGAYTKQGCLWRYIPRLIEKNEGKPFDEVYSKFCQKYPAYLGSMNTREVFKGFFENFGKFYGYTYRGRNFKAYVDDDGIIRLNKLKASRRRGKFSVPMDDEVIVYYKANLKYLKNHPNLDRYIYSLIGYDMYHFITTVDKISETLGLKLYALFEKHHNNLVQAIEEDDGPQMYVFPFKEMFERIVERDSIDLEKGSPEYIKYRAERADAKKRELREWKEQNKVAYEAALRKLKELEQQKKEKDIIDRDRLGFDNKSFKKEKEE